jgi:(p)ppGpp synthase/HD superfamily hydrolase
MVLSNRFEEALIFATRLHARQVRKASSIPYVSHLLIVAGMVLEQGGDEDTAIAALLHDAVEDQGGRPMLDEIRRRFGDRVAEIVEECSDAFTFFKPPWRKRKKAYLAHLPQASAAARLVSAADKLHNARTTLADYRALGEALWRRFNGGREGTLWFYRAMVEALRAGGPSPLVEELDRVVSELERLASAQGNA